MTLLYLSNSRRKMRSSPYLCITQAHIIKGQHCVPHLQIIRSEIQSIQTRRHRTYCCACPLADCSVLHRGLSRMPREARLVAKRQNGNLRRRIETLLIKAYEIWNDYGVDVAMFLNNKGQYYIYRSIERPTWPPLLAEIVSNANILRVCLTQDRKPHTLSIRTYPQAILRRELQSAGRQHALVQSAGINNLQSLFHSPLCNRLHQARRVSSLLLLISIPVFKK
jgi:hypothetical protein